MSATRKSKQTNQKKKENRKQKTGTHAYREHKDRKISYKER